MRYPIERFLIVLLSMLIAVGCTGLAGEPEIVRTIPVPPTPLPAMSQNLDTPVSLMNGATIYAQNCSRCHGVGGAGDGEFVASGQIEMISDFTDPQTTRDQSLQTWYDTITNGRLEQLMPPWENALSAQERWAVALYTYTMPYTEQQITAGEALYAAECSVCHAPDGTGTADGQIGRAHV